MKAIKGRSSHLSVTEEEELVHWIKVTQCLYNKKLSGYKDKEEKDRLWKTKAASMGKTTETLAIRYRTLRTRYSRLLKAGKQIGDKLTERDQWVLTRMAFLKNHVHEVCNTHYSFFCLVKLYLSLTLEMNNAQIIIDRANICSTVFLQNL